MAQGLNCRVTFPESHTSDRIDTDSSNVIPGTEHAADDHNGCEYNHDERVIRRTKRDGQSKTHRTAELGMIGQSSRLKAPVIVLLGWYGSRYEDLAKYSAIFQARSCITIEYSHNYLRGRKKLKDVATKVLESVFELGLQDHPIIFHLFSGGGGYIYGHVTTTVNGPEPGKYGSLDIRGVILDSLPCLITPRVVYQSFVAMLPSSLPWAVDDIIAFMITVLYPVILVIKKSQQHKLDVYYRAMVDDRMRCPQLFLYSKADKIAPYTDIQAAITGRRERGVKVQEVCWEDTGHVGHLKKHEGEYANVCLNFVEACLKEETMKEEKTAPTDNVTATSKKSKL